MITMKEISIWCLVILVSSKQINGQCGDNNQYCEPDTCCPLHDTCCDMAGSPNGMGCCPIENVRKKWPFATTCHCQNSTSHIVPQIVVTYLTICLRNTFYSLFVGSLLRWWALLLLPRLQVYRRWSLCRDKTCRSQHDLNRWRTLNSWHTAFTLKNPVIPYLTSISFIPR